MSAIPYVKFFPSDWLSEESLRLVSYAARGLWIDMLCLMAKNQRRGYLEVTGGLTGGVKPTLAQLAKLTCGNEAEIGALLDELKGAGVCSIEPETGVIYSRRMVRDTELYNQSVAFGKQGGNPVLNRRRNKRLNPPVKPNGQPSLGSGSMGSGFNSSSGSESPINGHSGRPSLDLWIAECERRHPDWPRKDAQRAWEHYEKVGWRTSSNVPIKKWEMCIGTCYGRWEEKHGRNGSQLQLTAEELNSRRV